MRAIIVTQTLSNHRSVGAEHYTRNIIMKETLRIISLGKSFCASSILFDLLSEEVLYWKARAVTWHFFPLGCFLSQVSIHITWIFILPIYDVLCVIKVPSVQDFSFLTVFLFPCLGLLHDVRSAPVHLRPSVDLLRYPIIFNTTVLGLKRLTKCGVQKERASYNGLPTFLPGGKVRTIISKTWI